MTTRGGRDDSSAPHRFEVESVFKERSSCTLFGVAKSDVPSGDGELRSAALLARDLPGERLDVTATGATETPPPGGGGGAGRRGITYGLLFLVLRRSGAGAQVPSVPDEEESPAVTAATAVTATAAAAPLWLLSLDLDEPAAGGELDPEPLTRLAAEEAALIPAALNLRDKRANRCGPPCWWSLIVSACGASELSSHSKSFSSSPQSEPCSPCTLAQSGATAVSG